MESIKDIIDIVLHLDEYLGVVIRRYDTWTYVLIFLIIFCETGLVITSFLPGETLLFTAGTFATLGLLDVEWLIVLLSIAAITGDNLNYWVGHFLGSKALKKENIFLINKDRISQTRDFYKKYGGNTIIIARFVPFIRTFSPFVAGLSHWSYIRFVAYDIIGGITWVLIFVLGGYLFGRVPMVKNNFILVILAIVVISLLPALIRPLYRRLRSA